MALPRLFLSDQNGIHIWHSTIVTEIVAKMMIWTADFVLLTLQSTVWKQFWFNLIVLIPVNSSYKIIIATLIVLLKVEQLQ